MQQRYASAETKLLDGMKMLVVVTAPVWAYFLFFPRGYSYGAGLVAIPTLVIVNAFLIASVSHDDVVLRQLLPLAFLFKLAATGTYLFLVKGLLQGGDVLAYHEVGSKIASDFLITSDWTSFTVSHGFASGSTLFIADLAGLLYLITGPSISTGMVVFSTISFWGHYSAYRAFVLAFPSGKRDTAALLLFLFPSEVFWTATIGKDAVIGFAISLAAYGFVRLLHAPGMRAYFYLTIGLGGTYVVRPHIAAMIAMAFIAAYIFGKNSRGFFGIAAKIATIPLLAIGNVWLFRQAQSFLNAETFSKALLAANNVTRNTNYGGSALGTSGGHLVSRIATAPFLLFRPFPWEINNVQAALASAEGLFLLALCWISRKQFKVAARRWRSEPFLLFMFFFIAEFSVVVAGTFSNIGLVARQRVMMLPFALMLLCSYSGEPASDRRESANAVRAWFQTNVRAQTWAANVRQH